MSAATPRILVANDDGIDAPGLGALANAARVLEGDVWIVAPERKWTAASHQLSFDQELVLTRVGEQSYSCSGAPADCVVAAMTVLFADGARPELVLAGVNDGRNVGEDAAYSGTMAIGREATFWRVPAVSLSRVKDAALAPGDDAVLCALLRCLWGTRASWSSDGAWLAVNLPARLPAPIVQAVIGRDKIATASDVVARTAELIRYRLRRGRAFAASPGDENAALAADSIAIVRHRWCGVAPLPNELIASWQRALG